MKTTIIGWSLLFLGWICLGIRYYTDLEYLNIISTYLFGISTGLFISQIIND